MTWSFNAKAQRCKGAKRESAFASLPLCAIAFRSSLLALSLAALALAGCGREELPQLRLETRPVLNFGFLPYSDEDHMRGLFDALAGYIGPALKMEINFILMRDYESIGHLLENKMVDVAWFTPASYVAIGRKVGARAIAKPFRRGKDRYRAIVVVRDESR